MAEGPITSKEIIELVSEALQQFGSYSMNDKGADEVMDIPAIIKRLKTMSSANIIKVLNEVWHDENDVNCGPCLSAIAYQLESWDDPGSEEIFRSEFFQEWY